MQSQQEKAAAWLEAATEPQLRNVLAMLAVPDAVLIALFERDQRMTAAESAEPPAEPKPRSSPRFSNVRGI
jgi:hypothetical protein